MIFLFEERMNIYQGLSLIYFMRCFRVDYRNLLYQRHEDQWEFII